MEKEKGIIEGDTMRQEGWCFPLIAMRLANLYLS